MTQKDEKLYVSTKIYDKDGELLETYFIEAIVKER